MATSIDTADPINYDHPLNQGVIHWWRGLPNNSGSTTMFDMVTRLGPNNGTISGALWDYDRFSNPTLKFDGTDDRIAFGDLADADGVTVLTVSAWVYSSTNAGGTSNLRYIASKEDGGGLRWVMRYNTGGGANNIEWIVNDAGGNKSTACGGFGANRWFHVLGSYQSGIGTQMFIDGASTAGLVNTTVATMSAGTQPVEVGSPAFSAGRAWQGWIQDVRIAYRRTTFPDAYELSQEAHTNNPQLLNHVSPRSFFFMSAVTPPTFDPISWYRPTNSFRYTSR